MSDRSDEERLRDLERRIQALEDEQVEAEEAWKLLRALAGVSEGAAAR